MNEQPRDSALKQMTQRIFFAWMFGGIMMFLFWVFGSGSEGVASTIGRDIWVGAVGQVWSVWLIAVGLIWGAMRFLCFISDVLDDLSQMRRQSQEKKKPANIGLFDANSAPSGLVEEVVFDEDVFRNHVRTRRLEEKR